MTVMAFPGHAGRFWPLARWRSLARIGHMLDSDRRALPALAYAVALLLVAFLGAERGRAASPDVNAALGPAVVVDHAATPGG